MSALVFGIEGKEKELESALQNVPLVKKGNDFYIRGVDEPSATINEDRVIMKTELSYMKAEEFG